MALSVFNNDSNASMSVVISVICLKSSPNYVRGSLWKNIDFVRTQNIFWGPKGLLGSNEPESTQLLESINIIQES